MPILFMNDPIHMFLWLQVLASYVTSAIDANLVMHILFVLSKQRIIRWKNNRYINNNGHQNHSSNQINNMAKEKWKNPKGLAKFDLVKFNPFLKVQPPTCISYKSKLNIASSAFRTYPEMYPWENLWWDLFDVGLK